MDETSPTAPSNPYGESKLAAEWLIRSAAAAYGMSWASLRYFNVAGAADSVLADRGRSNLLPIVLRAADRDEPVEVYGGDWPTPDGTCVRDYVHVEDLADAHVAMAESLRTGSVRSGVFNVGRGDGVSVLQMLDAVHRVTGRPVRRRVVDRRPGTPHGWWPTRPRSPRRSAGARNGLSTTSSGARGRPTDPARERSDVPGPDTPVAVGGSVSGLISSSAARGRRLGHNGDVGCVGPADARRGEGQDPRWVITSRGARLANPRARGSARRS